MERSKGAPGGECEGERHRREAPNHSDSAPGGDDEGERHPRKALKLRVYPNKWQAAPRAPPATRQRITIVHGEKQRCPGGECEGERHRREAPKHNDSAPGGEDEGERHPREALKLRVYHVKWQTAQHAPPATRQ